MPASSVWESRKELDVLKEKWKAHVTGGLSEGRVGSGGARDAGGSLVGWSEDCDVTEAQCEPKSS